MGLSCPACTNRFSKVIPAHISRTFAIEQDFPSNQRTAVPSVININIRSDIITILDLGNS